MKKLSAFAACALAALLLAGCSERTYTGILTAPGDGATRSFTMRGRDGTAYSVKVTEDVPVVAWPEGTEPGDLYSGNWPALRLSVKGRASLFGEPVSLTAGSVQIDAARQPEGLTLADGTSLSVWQASFDREYCAPDGTVLLEEQLGSEAADALENAAGLSQEAKENILAFYEAQGILYDLPAQLERAWAAYSEADEGFELYTLGQEVNLCAENGSTLWLVTTVTLPLGGRVVTEEPLCAAFDKATGEALTAEELFTCTGETLAAALLDAAGITDEPRRGEMLAAFGENRVVFRGEALEVFYPEGAVPSEETALILGLDYTDEVKALLQPRALPQRAT
ncbi:hypothetical protein [Candidatus Allofournierella excrementavium]|uniref:hypothetical protein n=1 Tax=Candidatus Allofournierella excrementavium TaxID=2838591 RepID=UPI00374F69DB